MANYPYLANYITSTEASRHVMNFLHTTYGYLVEDLTDDIPAQGHGLDFAVARPDGPRKTVEFKYDNQIHRTGNLAFEIFSNFSLGRAGSCLTSQADYLLYYDPVKLVCHKLKLRALVLEIEASPKTIWTVAKANTHLPYHQEKLPEGYCGLSLLLPLDYLRNLPSIEYRLLDLNSYFTSLATAH